MLASGGAPDTGAGTLRAALAMHPGVRGSLRRGCSARRRFRRIAAALFGLATLSTQAAGPAWYAASATPASTAATAGGVTAATSAFQASARLNVMSFNIRYGTANDGDNAWVHRRDTVAEVIESSDIDVAGLQEALHFQLEELMDAMPRYQLIGVGRDDGLQAGEYAAILIDGSRLEVLDQGTFWFSDTPDVPGSTSWGNEIPRICTWARLRDRDSGSSFYVFNVHWDHQSQPSRERSGELLIDTIARRVSREPVLVTGDFNAGESNAAFRYLLGSEASSRVGLADTYRALHPDAVDVGTFNGFEGTTSGDKIDAVLASAHWSVLAADIVRVRPSGRYPSDHFPVVAALELR